MLAQLSFHGAICAYYVWLNYQSYQLVSSLYSVREDVYHSMTGGGLELFTVWTQIIQQTYFYVCFVLDILEYTTNGAYKDFKSLLSKVKLYMFPCLVLPTAVMVPVNFWTFYMVNPHLLDNRGVMNLYILPWYNHCLHTLVAPIALLEIAISSRVYPSKTVGFLAIAFMLKMYCLCLVVCYLIGNTFPYPFMEIMTNGHRLAYYFTNCAIGVVAYVLGDALNSILWGEQLHMRTLQLNFLRKHDSSVEVTENGSSDKKID